MRLALIKTMRDLTRRPLRTLLTVAGVVLGIAAFVGISTTGYNLTRAQQATYASTAQPDITAFVAQASPGLLNLVQRRDNVAAVDSRAVQYTRITAGRNWVSTKLIGIDDFSSVRLDVPILVAGRWPGRGEIALDVTTRSLLQVDIGDLVALQPTVADPTTYARVSGFARAPATLDASIGHQVLAFAPASDVRRLIGSQYDNMLLVKTLDPETASATAREIERFLARRGVPSSGWTVRDPEAFVGSRELTTLFALLRAFSALGLVVSGFIVANTVAAMLVEERRQIGILKALGAGRRDIALTYLPVSALFGLTGAIGGLVLGLVLAQTIAGYLAGLTGLVLPSFTLRWSDGVLAFVSGLLVSTGSAAFPIWRALREPAAAALASPGISPDVQPGILYRLRSRLPGRMLLAATGLRNVPRRPARASSTAAVIAVAVAAFVASQAVTQSVSTTVDQLYARYRADGWILFTRAVHPSLARELERDSEVLVAEPWARASGAFDSVRTDVWGIPDDTRVYQPHLLAGSWLQRNRPVPTVVTGNLARRLHASVGQVRRLDLGDRPVLVEIVGIVDDESTYLGATTTGKVFLRFDDLQRLRGQDDRAGLFGLRFLDGTPAAVDATLGRLEQQYRLFRPLTLAFYQDQEIARQVIAILSLLLRSVVVIVVAVGLFGIANTLLLNLSERRREFGICRALGASATQIHTIVLSEGVGMAVLGYSVGLAVGYPLARYLVELTGEHLFRLSFVLTPATIALAFGLAVVATAVGSAVPGAVAARVRPVEVLRYE